MRVLQSICMLLLLFNVDYLKGNEKRFNNISTISGMSLREARGICEDEDGFIWASTKSGIVRIMSNDFRIYTLNFAKTDVLYTDITYNAGVLIAYTSNGLIFRYNKFTDTFEQILDMRDKLNSAYLAIGLVQIFDKDEYWLATSQGLYVLKNADLRLVNADAERVRRLLFIGNSVYYVKNSVLVHHDRAKQKKIAEWNFAEFSNSVISKMYYDKSGTRILLGTLSDGLFAFDLKTRKIISIRSPYIPLQPILAIEKNTDSTIIVGVDGQGLLEFDNDFRQLLGKYKEDHDDPYSLNGDGVYHVFRDRYNRVWVSTYGGGLSYFDQKPTIINHVTNIVNNKNSLGNKTVNRIIQSRNGDFWFATNNGISRWNMRTNRWERYLENTDHQAKVFLTIAEDGKGNIWGGTYSSGIYILDGNSGKLMKHYDKIVNESGFSSRFVFDIFLDSEKNVWLGGNHGGLFCYSPNDDKFRLYDATFDVNKIIEVSKNEILIVSSYGLVLLNKITGVFEVLITQYIFNDIIVHDGYYWLATRGAGMLCYNPRDKSIVTYTIENGLKSNFVNSIIESNGDLWLGTEMGMTKFDPVNRIVKNYNSEFALSKFAFNSRAVINTDKNLLMWGTNNGIVYFDPKRTIEHDVNARIFTQDIFVSGQSIRFVDNIRYEGRIDDIEKMKFKYYQNTFSLDLIAIAESAEELRFSWKLAGYDSDWSTPTASGKISYSNLMHGRYELLVRLYDSSLTNIIDEKKIVFRIIPAFWETWWFRIFVLLLIGFAIYYYIRVYTSKIRQKHTEEKIQFFTNMAHDIRTSLTLIKAPIENISNETRISEKGKYFINVAAEQINRMSFVVTQLLDLQKVDIGKGQVFLVNVDLVSLLKKRIAMFELLAKNKNISINVYASCDTYKTAVDELKIEKVIDNLLSNAIKFSLQNATVDISLVCSSEKWVLTVCDYGIGISHDDQKKLFREFYRGENSVNSRIVGSGIGLLLVKNYVSMHNGEITLNSEEGSGSTFVITIPHVLVEDKLAKSDSIEKDELLYIDNATLPELPEDAGVEAVGKKANLLVVEDNVELQNFLKVSLEDDFNISIANNGLEAWLKVQKNAPDIIISDVMMPQMDGFELCRHMKSTFETSHIPIILLTALSDKAQELEGLGLGADDYITKPFDMTLLNQRIKTVVRNRQVVRNRVLRVFKQPETDTQLLHNEQNDQFLKKAIEVVRKNIDNSEFSKEDFAAAMCASTSLLYKKIKSLTGQSPNEFIKVIRLNKSMELLQTRNYSVTEVSEMCGFSSVGYFSTVFKKYFQKIPTEI